MTSLPAQVCAASETKRSWETTWNALLIALLILPGMLSLKGKKK